uniref:uncharacterized protein n=1 Tax=Myxine glutinosa TaxID=7769 RepID=UPI00358F2B28
MNRDVSGEDHRSNPPGSTSGSDGGNSVVPGDSPSDRGSRVGPPEDEDPGPGVIVKVKVKSEFVDDSFTQHEGFIVKVKVKSEFEDESTFQDTDLVHPVKMEDFQSHFSQSSQDALSNECVKQEPCASSLWELKNAPKMHEESFRSEAEQGNTWEVKDEQICAGVQGLESVCRQLYPLLSAWGKHHRGCAAITHKGSVSFHSMMVMKHGDTTLTVYQVTGKRISRRDFIAQLVGELRQGYSSEPLPQEVQQSSSVEQAPPAKCKRHQCQTAKCRNKTVDICAVCSKQVCGKCTGQVIRKCTVCCQL